MQLGNRKPKNVYSLPLQGDKRGSILFYLPSQFLHKRLNNLAQHLIIEAVLAFKTDYVRVVFVEEVVGLHHGVVDAEETIAFHFVVVSDVLKLLSLNHVMMLDKFASDLKLLLIILSAVEEFMDTGLHHATCR